MESCLSCCHGGTPPPGWLPPLCDGWLGCSASMLTKRTCLVLSQDLPSQTNHCLGLSKLRKMLNMTPGLLRLTHFHRFQPRGLKSERQSTMECRTDLTLQKKFPKWNLICSRLQMNTQVNEKQDPERIEDEGSTRELFYVCVKFPIALQGFFCFSKSQKSSDTSNLHAAVDDILDDDLLVSFLITNGCTGIRICEFVIVHKWSSLHFQDKMEGVPHKKASKSHSVSGSVVTPMTTGSGLRKWVKRKPQIEKRNDKTPDRGEIVRSSEHGEESGDVGWGQWWKHPLLSLHTCFLAVAGVFPYSWEEVHTLKA